MVRMARAQQTSVMFAAAFVLAVYGAVQTIERGVVGWETLLVLLPFCVSRLGDRRQEAGAQPRTIVLRGVERGLLDGKAPSPALTQAIEKGYVAVRDDERYVLTARGHSALNG